MWARFMPSWLHSDMSAAVEKLDLSSVVRCLVEAACVIRDGWSPELEGLPKFNDPRRKYLAQSFMLYNSLLNSPVFDSTTNLGDMVGGREEQNLYTSMQELGLDRQAVLLTLHHVERLMSSCTQPIRARCKQAGVSSEEVEEFFTYELGSKLYRLECYLRKASI